MSRAKTSKVNKEKVMQALYAKGLQQKELADRIGMNYQALNRALHKGLISQRALEQIGFELDVAPEYLADNPSCIPGAPTNYWVHLSQDEQIGFEAITRALWIRNGFSRPEVIPRKDFWGLYNAIEPVMHQYVDSYRERQRVDAIRKGS